MSTGRSPNELNVSKEEAIELSIPGDNGREGGFARMPWKGWKVVEKTNRPLLIRAPKRFVELPPMALLLALATGICCAGYSWSCEFLLPIDLTYGDGLTFNQCHFLKFRKSCKIYSKKIYFPKIVLVFLKTT